MPPFCPISCYSRTMAVAFTPSQLSFKQETSPISFRISPFQLLRSDSKLISSLLGYVPLIIVPFTIKQSTKRTQSTQLWKRRCHYSAGSVADRHSGGVHWTGVCLSSFRFQGQHWYCMLAFMWQCADQVHFLVSCS